MPHKMAFATKRVIMESDIDILPQEVLHSVFSKLSILDRLNASVVCKKWLEVLNSKSLLKDITILINNNDTAQVFTSMSRNFLNFSFELITVDNKYYELFKRLSIHIEYLSFKKCEVCKREPINFGDLRFDNLKVLRIIHCKLWTLFPCLPHLTELYLIGGGIINDEGIAILQKSMKHLKVLTILCYVSCAQKKIKRFYSQDMTYEANSPSLILSFSAISSFVSERAKTLKEIYLGAELTGPALKDLSSIKDLNLHKINLKDGFSCADGLIDLFKNQPSLKSINLKHVFNVNDDIIDALCSLLPDIEEICLPNCTLTNRSLSKLFLLTKLNKLDIGRGPVIRANVFNEAVLNFKAIQIKSLNLSRRINEAEFMTLDVLFKHCKYLTYLDLSYNRIPDTVMHIISETLVHLENLCLKNCGITDYGLTGRKRLNKLFKDRDITVHHPLSNLKHLTKLDLSDSDEISDNAVVDTIKFKYLEFLYVSGCKLKLDTVQFLLQQNPSIRKIVWDDDAKNPKIEKKKTDSYLDFFKKGKKDRCDICFHPDAEDRTEEISKLRNLTNLFS